MNSWLAIWNNAPQIELNKLPEYSCWPARLLELEKWTCPQRTPEEAWREYEQENYFPLLSYARSHPGKSYTEIVQSSFPTVERFCCFAQDEFRLLSFEEALTIQGKLFANIVKKYLPAAAIVELGAGTGQTLLEIKKNIPDGQTFIALEPMPSARELLRMFANKGQNVAIGSCNLLKSPFTKEKIPVGSICYTSFATCFLEKLNCEQYIQEMFKLQPKVVISFEPCIDMLDENSLHHCLIKKYILANCYNTTLYPFLKKNKHVEILAIEKNFWGNNPFLPTSAIIWKKK